MPAIEAEPASASPDPRRSWRSGLPFLIVALLAVAAIWLQLELFECHNDDPAGCGMSRGFGAIIGYGLMMLDGVAALVYLLPWMATRALAWLVVGGIGIVAAIDLTDTISANLRATGTVDGIDPHPPEAAPDYALRRTMRCFLAAEVRRAEDKEAAKTFDEMAAYFAGQLADMGQMDDSPAALKIAREEGRKLKAEGEPFGAIGACADLQLGDNDARQAWLEAAGYDAGELEKRREDAYKLEPKPDRLDQPTGNTH